MERIRVCERYVILDAEKIIRSHRILDLSFWYSDGPGNPTAAPQGAGWMVELLARLTRTPITSNDFGLNFTLSSSPVTFPLDQPMYLDFSHDVVIANST